MKLLADQFVARQRALEAVFFQNVDARLIANLRNELSQLEEAHKLAHVSEIMDEHVLRDLVQVGVTAESLLAMRFVPMIKVAWSDGYISPAERAAVLKAAVTENIQPDSPAYQLLCNWLERPPEKAVFVAWKEYIHELAQHMPADSLTKLRQRTASLCNRVAKASGGVLGFGGISHVERETIEDCLATYDG